MSSVTTTYGDITMGTQNGTEAELKGGALTELSNGRIRRAELHWYDGHGIGNVDL